MREFLFGLMTRIGEKLSGLTLSFWHSCHQSRSNIQVLQAYIKERMFILSLDHVSFFQTAKDSADPWYLQQTGKKLVKVRITDTVFEIDSLKHDTV